MAASTCRAVSSSADRSQTSLRKSGGSSRRSGDNMRKGHERLLPVYAASAEAGSSTSSRERSREASRTAKLKVGFARWWPYYVMMAPGLLFFLIWHYVPIWEAKMAFE